jgi:hypothetical protein
MACYRAIGNPAYETLKVVQMALGRETKGIKTNVVALLRRLCQYSSRLVHRFCGGSDKLQGLGHKALDANL